jgi:hypothetical protein
VSAPAGCCAAAARQRTRGSLLAAFTKPPYKCENEGWGEFELLIDCYITEKQKQQLHHDLHFQSNSYDAIHTVSFKNPSQALQLILRESGPLPDDKKKATSSKKPSQKYDLEKIAEALEKLEEDDLLRVIQIIQDHKTPDTYIKSDVDGMSCPPFSLPRWPPSLLPDQGYTRDCPVNNVSAAGEFSIDLFTMSDALTKALWEHLVSCHPRGSSLGQPPRSKRRGLLI